jgi:hypothetical protein
VQRCGFAAQHLCALPCIVTCVADVTERAGRWTLLATATRAAAAQRCGFAESCHSAKCMMFCSDSAVALHVILQSARYSATICMSLCRVHEILQWLCMSFCRVHDTLQDSVVVLQWLCSHSAECAILCSGSACHSAECTIFCKILQWFYSQSACHSAVALHVFLQSGQYPAVALHAILQSGQYTARFCGASAATLHDILQSSAADLQPVVVFLDCLVMQ